MSKPPLRTALFILLVAFMSTIPTAVMAQSTTSSIAGTATDSEGVLPGAVITTIHTPSGTRYSTIANQKGAYRLKDFALEVPITLKPPMWDTIRPLPISVVSSSARFMNVISTWPMATSSLR